MTSRSRGVLLIVIGTVAFAVGVLCWFAVGDLAWKVAGVVLAVLAVTSWVAGARLVRSASSDGD